MDDDWGYPHWMEIHTWSQPLFRQAGALESLVSALRHHNDPESLRCLAATLSSLLSDDLGLLRVRAVEAGGVIKNTHWTVCY